MSFLLSFPEYLRNSFVITAFFLIILSHIVLAVPLNWMRGRKLILIIIFFVIIALKIFVPSEWGHYFKGRICFLKGQYERAEIEGLKVLSINPEFYGAYIDLGNVYAAKGDFIKARKCYFHALKLWHSRKLNLKIIYYNLGNAYLQEMDAETSWFYYRNAYETKTGYESSWWPYDISDPKYYVKSNDKERFKKAMALQKMPDSISKRINDLKQKLSNGLGKEVYQESQKYLEENPGTVYQPHFLSLMEKGLKKIHPDDVDYQSFNLMYQNLVGKK